MRIPSRNEAESFLAEAQTLNPGSWYSHSLFVAEAAEIIADHHPHLDSEKAYILGSLHDIGRRAGITGMRHILDGYHFMHANGFSDVARICITHSFPIKDIVFCVTSEWDCSPEEIEFVRKYLLAIEFTEYDKLIQLCDALALPTGLCLIEKRLLDVSLRYGTNEYSVPRWKAYLSIQQEFEQVIESSIYKILPGVVENTFGFDPC
jgi:HD domain